MNASSLQLPWKRPEWKDQITSWIGEQLAGHGRRMTGPVEMVHQRPWAAFARMATINRALSCYDTFRDTSEEDKTGYADGVSDWLKEFLEAEEAADGSPGNEGRGERPV